MILATAIQANLQEIGFNVKIRQVEDINAALKTPDWDLAINSPGIMTNGGAPDSALQEYLTTKGERNYGGVTDAELDNQIETLSLTFDAEKRKEILLIALVVSYLAFAAFGNYRNAFGMGSLF